MSTLKNIGMEIFEFCLPPRWTTVCKINIFAPLTITREGHFQWEKQNQAPQSMPIFLF